MKRFNEDFISYTQEYEDKQKRIVDEVIRIASNFLTQFFIFHSKSIYLKLDIWTQFNI